MPETDGRNLPEHCAAKGGSDNTTTQKEGKGAERTFLPLTGHSIWEMFRGFAEAGHAKFRARNSETSLRKGAPESLRPLIPFLSWRGGHGGRGE